MKVIEIKKGEILQHKGELNTKIFLVKKGLLRSYFIDEKGRIHIFMFGAEGWCVADSTEPDQPCELFIDAIEDSTVEIFEKAKEPSRDVKAFIKRIYVLQRRVIMLMSSTALERYENFLETYPEIAQRIPQKMIAAYLGVTPEALSKIKRNYLK